MIGRKKTGGYPIAEAARRKVDKVPASEVLLWADNAGAGVARALSAYQSHRRREDLDEAYEAVLAMVGCLESLRDRQ